MPRGVNRIPDPATSGGTAEETIVDLFADDAVYIEPFSKGTVSGETTTHSGKAAIHDFFRGSWHARPPDMRLTLDTISIDGSFVRADWTCTAEVFGSPMRGFDRYLIRDGRIARLETTVTQPPSTITFGAT